LLREKVRKRIIFFKNSKKIKSLWKDRKRILFNAVLSRIQKIKINSKKITEKQKIIIDIIEEVLIEIIEKL
jgi:hypothetical protein